MSFACFNRFIFYFVFVFNGVQAEKAHAQIDETGTGLKDVLQDLLQMIEEAASQAGVVSNMIDSITKSMAEVCTLTALTCTGT